LCVSESCASGADAVDTVDTVNCTDDDDDDDVKADNVPWQQRVGNDVTTAADSVVSSSDVTLTADRSPSAVDNDVSTLSAGDTNGVSPTSTGESVTSDGSFNGFIAMHRKMVCRHFLLVVTFTSVWTL